MRYPLPNTCLLLCGTCLGEKQAVFPCAKIRRGISKRRRSCPAAPVIKSGVGGTKMSPIDECEAATSANRNRAEPVEIWKARRYIHQHAEDQLSLSKVAKAVNISANHLSEKFKQVTHISFVDYVARARFEILGASAARCFVKLGVGEVFSYVSSV